MTLTLILCGIVAGGALLAPGKSRLVRNNRERDIELGLQSRDRS